MAFSMYPPSLPPLSLPPLSPLPPSLQLKLTAEYLELVRYQSISSNTKLYFGPSIPSLFLKETPGAGGGLSSDVLKPIDVERIVEALSDGHVN